MTEPRKAIINVIYAPQKGPPKKVYETEKGEIWRSKSYDVNKINIGMGWYSLRDVRNKKTDALLVLEPYCVLPRDYRVGFANQFSHIFTWATKAFEHPRLKHKVVEINHPSCWGIKKPELIGNDWPAWEDRADEIVFVANNKSSAHHSQLYSARIALADQLFKNSRFKVSWYGQIPLKRPYYRGELKNKLEKLKTVKFSVCTENSYDPIYTHNYFTEKMPEVWLSGAVPLYMGCYNIDEMFSDYFYIDLRKCIKKGRAQKLHLENGRLEKIIKRMYKFNKSNHADYAAALKKEIQTNRLHDAISFFKMYDTFIDTYFKEINP